MKQCLTLFPCLVCPRLFVLQAMAITTVLLALALITGPHISDAAVPAIRVEPAAFPIDSCLWLPEVPRQTVWFWGGIWVRGLLITPALLN